MTPFINFGKVSLSFERSKRISMFRSLIREKVVFLVSGSLEKYSEGPRKFKVS